MKVKITHTMCRNHDYLDNYSCPLAVALKKVGFKDVLVLGHSVEVDGEEYDFSFNKWNSAIWEEVIGSRRSILLNIPGLKAPKRDVSKN